MIQPSKMNLDPMPFDEEERQIMDDFEKGLDEGTLVSELTDDRRATIEASARVTMSPPKAQVTTHLAKNDLLRLKSQALELGMPYQTLLASIIHRYVEGELIER